MGWQDEMTTILRHTINDVDDPQLYTDSRLQLAILVGAQFVNTEFDWYPNTYQVNIGQLSLAPDPTTTAGSNFKEIDLNNWFVNLTVLKTSLIMFGNNLRTASQQAFIIKDIDVVVDLRQVAAVNKQIYDEMVKYYDYVSMQYRSAVRCPGQAILGPINVLAGNWTSAQYGYGEVRDRIVY